MAGIDKVRDQYRAGPSTHQQFGRKHRVLRSHLTGISVILPEEPCNWLESCRSFRSFDEYVGERITRWIKSEMEQHGVVRGAWRILLGTLLDHIRKRPADGSVMSTVRTIRRQIEELVEAGMFMSRSELLRRLRASAQENEARTTITTIAIPAADHPELATRCLASFMENQAAYGRKTRFLVGSYGSEISDKAFCEARNLATRYDAHLTFLGPSDHVSFAKRLARETGLPDDIVSFAIPGEAGGSPGVGRNAVLLASPGLAFLSVDEDVLCQPFSIETEDDQGVRVWDSSFDPRTYRFFADLAAAKALLKACPVDILSAHESLLGRTVPALTRVYDDSGRIELDRADGRCLEDIWWGRGRALLTTTGVIGPSGVHWPLSFLDMPQFCRAQILGSEAVCRSASESEAVMAGVCYPTISNAAYVTSKLFALDDRITLPPFLPGLRDDGILFGKMLRCCHEHAYTGVLPCSFVHDPPAATRHPKDFMWRQTGFDLACYLADLFDEMDLRSAGSDPAARLVAMGRFLRLLGRQPIVEFIHVIRRLFLARITALLAGLESSLQVSGSMTASRTEYIRRRMESLRSALLREDAAVPQDLCGSSSCDGSWDQARSVVQKCGELLEAWPAIVEGAKTLDARGAGLASMC